VNPIPELWRTPSLGQQVEDRISEGRRFRERLVELGMELRSRGLVHSIELIDEAIIELAKVRQALEAAGHES